MICSARWLRVVAAGAVGYTAGLAPSADVATRLATRGQVDLRSTGSGNPGAANAGAVLGVRRDWAVMAADITKGAAAARRGWPNGWGGRPTAGLPLAALASSAVITQRFVAARAR